MKEVLQQRLLGGFLLLGLVACDASFDPKGDYNEQLVVYSTLSTQTAPRYVRVVTTYNPAAFDPGENTLDHPVRNAQVTISGGGRTYQFRDTTIQRIDKSRYSTDISAYVTDPFVVERGRSYQLTVVTPSFTTVTSSLTVPGQAFISVLNSFVLKDPSKFQEDIFVDISTTPITRGYILRLLLDYEYVELGVRKLQRIEVPSVSQRSDGDPSGYVYPRLTRRTSASLGDGHETASFSLAAYRSLIQQLILQYTAKNLIITKAVFILTQVESNLYNYYNIVNGFQDEFSIRTDQPDFSNIKGGLGVFGAMAIDSTSIDLSLSF